MEAMVNKANVFYITVLFISKITSAIKSHADVAQIGADLVRRACSATTSPVLLPSS